jgi:hypothetical protein
MTEPLDRCLFMGLVDVWSWNCGRRPMIKSEAQIAALIAWRFQDAGVANNR